MIAAAGRFAPAVAAVLGAAPVAAETVHVRSGGLIDPASGSVTREMLLTIVDGRITAIGRGAAPAGATVIDWRRFHVLPGLIDMHTHVADGFAQDADPASALRRTAAETALAGAAAARATLRAGFTSIRDLGVYRGLADVALRARIDSGAAIGPRMTVAGGYITRPGGGGAVTGAAPGTEIPEVFRLGEVRGAANAAARVNALIDGGADVIKAAIAAGVRSIENASLIGDGGIALAKARGVWLDMDIYNGDWIDDAGRKQGWPAEYLRKNIETTKAQRDGFRKAVRVGAKLAFGTDAGVYPHGRNARQFAYMVRWGMTPLHAIRSATTIAADLLGKAGEVGCVAVGCFGDLVVVARDPLRDVRALEDVAGVIKGGIVVRQGPDPSPPMPVAPPLPPPCCTR